VPEKARQLRGSRRGADTPRAPRKPPNPKLLIWHARIWHTPGGVPITLRAAARRSAGPRVAAGAGETDRTVWVVRVGGDNGELRPWHYIYVYSIESRLIMRIRYKGRDSMPAGGTRQCGPLLLHRNVQRFRGGLVFKAHRLCVSLNSRLASNKEREEEDLARRGKKAGGARSMPVVPHPSQSVRGGLVYKAHRLLYQSTLGLRVIM